MKDKRDPSKWTNQEIQHDTSGYFEAQRNFREDKDEEIRKSREQDDLRRYTAEFVANGGKEEDAASAFWSQRNESAADAAKRANEEAAEAGRERIRSAL